MFYLVILIELVAYQQEGHCYGCVYTYGMGYGVTTSCVSNVIIKLSFALSLENMTPIFVV